MKRHPIELLSFISGLVFLGFAAAYVIGAVLDFTPRTLLTLPFLFVGLGAAGIAAAIAAQHRIDAAHASGDPEQPGI
jgi:hypothetical protein